MQTAKANSKSKQSGKTAVRTPAVSEAVAAQAQDPVAAGSPDMKPAEPQATDIGAVNPVAETSPAEQPAAHPETDVRLLDLNKIVNSTYNPRKNFREDTLLELAESIKQSGVLQPICVRPRDEGFEIVYGERRYWAAAMAGLQFIPALIRELSDAEAEDAAITENLQREDVRPREEAAAYKRALQSGRHTIESLVGKFGKFVQAVLKKAADLDIQIICPLHGPVLTENLGYYLDTYNTWSSYQPEDEGITIAYASVYGHLKAAVEELAAALEARGQKVSVFDLARADMAEAVEDAFRYDRLVLASITYQGEIFPFMSTFIHTLAEHAYQNRTVALVEAGSWAPAAAKVMTKELEGMKDITLTQNKVTVLGSLNDASRAQIEALADELSK